MSRYHNLDVLLDGSGNQSRGPLDRWSEMEMWIYQHKEDTAFLNRLMQKEPGLFGREWYPRLARIQVACLQRAARALCRIWTLGPLQEDAGFATGLIGRFLYLQDHHLPFIPDKSPEEKDMTVALGRRSGGRFGPFIDQPITLLGLFGGVVANRRSCTVHRTSELVALARSVHL